MMKNLSLKKKNKDIHRCLLIIFFIFLAVFIIPMRFTFSYSVNNTLNSTINYTILNNQYKQGYAEIFLDNLTFIIDLNLTDMLYFNFLNKSYTLTFLTIDTSYAFPKAEFSFFGTDINNTFKLTKGPTVALDIPYINQNISHYFSFKIVKLNKSKVKLQIHIERKPLDPSYYLLYCKGLVINNTLNITKNSSQIKIKTKNEGTYINKNKGYFKDYFKFLYENEAIIVLIKDILFYTFVIASTFLIVLLFIFRREVNK